MPFPAYDTEGDERIVFGVDIGTTSSTSGSLTGAILSLAGAVSFVHLMPGVAPTVRVVSKWQNQEDTMSMAGVFVNLVVI